MEKVLEGVKEHVAVIEELKTHIDDLLVDETILPEVEVEVVEEEKSKLVIEIEKILESSEKDEILKIFIKNLIYTKNSIFDSVEELRKNPGVSFPEIISIFVELYVSSFTRKNKNDVIELCRKTVKLLLSTTSHMEQLDMILDTTIDLIKLNKTLKIKEKAKKSLVAWISNLGC